MSEYAFDIETIGLPMDSFDPKQVEWMQRKALRHLRDEEGSDYIPGDAEIMETVRRRRPLIPWALRVCCIGMRNLKDGKSGAYYLDDTVAPNAVRWVNEGGVNVLRAPEAVMLERFWADASKSGRLVTFNGRGFDGPVLALRSVMLGVKPTMNLCGYRFSLRPHCDLLEVATFYGGYRMGYASLDMICRSMGIESPKLDGGIDIDALHAEGKSSQIVDYCLGDVRATAELYEKMLPLVKLLEASK